MAQPLTVIDASEPVEKILDIIRRDGGCIVSNLLDPELLKEVVDNIEPYFEGKTEYSSAATHNELGSDFFPKGTQRIYALLGKIPEQLTKIMRLPAWQGIMSGTLW